MITINVKKNMSFVEFLGLHCNSVCRYFLLPFRNIISYSSAYRNFFHVIAFAIILKRFRGLYKSE